uniref:ORF-C n=1 Tax=Cyclospora cayetanensis TaxID=88456 RepID=A0A193BMF9_9EIME|nr:ORF-C [Cyclospora cayetanensis]ANN13312.1 ORF-C [Cyclospora cayetanensis]ANN13341.1 ORF-C [Cyclospora cayetanensis]ANN13370.1 ORF-C [Cyclospora cayetanensis]ANN13399.1 ORF-C [Cyclospora cayetanensis]
MAKLKFLKVKKKHKQIFFLKLTKKKKTTKFNNSLFLGNYISNINIYIFLYLRIIFYSKLGVNNSKQFTLISLFYLKNFLNKNIKK